MEVLGPIPVDETSRPFRSARSRSSYPAVDLDAVDYVEEEYFLSGEADAFDPDDNVLAHGLPFTTRFLVRRPADPSRASGTVVMEPFHNLSENTPTWGMSARLLTRRGDAWIGVTVHSGSFASSFGRAPGGVRQLQEVAPGRYGGLRLQAFENPPSRSAPAGPGGFDPEEMRWRLSIATAQGNGIASILAELVKRGQVQGLVTTRLFATGSSQTGLFWQQFLDRGLHEATGGPHGAAIDGYVITVAPAPVHRPQDAVLVNLLSEGEVVGTLNPGVAAAEDSETPRVRGYEVPGSFHMWEIDPRLPRPEGHDCPHNDRSWSLLYHAVLANLDGWVRDGVAMPRSPGITRDPTAADGVARDVHGNALGGLRNPWVDVPTATYEPRCTCSPTLGRMRPFTEDQLARLYGSRSGYLDQWNRVLEQMVRSRTLLAEDADLLRRHPE